MSESGCPSSASCINSDGSSSSNRKGPGRSSSTCQLPPGPSTSICSASTLVVDGTPPDQTVCLVTCRSSSCDSSLRPSEESSSASSCGGDACRASAASSAMASPSTSDPSAASPPDRSLRSSEAAAPSAARGPPMERITDVTILSTAPSENKCCCSSPSLLWLQNRHSMSPTDAVRAPSSTIACRPASPSTVARHISEELRVVPSSSL